MYRLSMAVSPAAVLIVGLLLSGALWPDEGKGFGFVFFHPASWKVKAGQVWEVADSIGIWIPR